MPFSILALFLSALLLLFFSYVLSKKGEGFTSPGTMVQLAASRPTPSMVWARYLPIKKREYMLVDQSLNDPLQMLRQQIEIPYSAIDRVGYSPYFSEGSIVILS
jgi:hypothetical protein